MVFISANPRLRKKHFNQYLVGLAFPDFLYSAGCAISCVLHWMQGTYFGGSTHCDLQGAYGTFGVAASLWMSALMAFETSRIATSAVRLQLYVPPSTKKVLMRIALVYCWAIAVACIPLLSGGHLTYNAAYGLACIPLQVSPLSELFFWIVFVPLAALIPACIISVVSWRTYREILCGLNLSGYQDLYKKVYSRECVLLNEFHDVVVTLGKILVAFSCFWSPSVLFMWAISDVSPYVSFIGGFISHLQGVCGAIIYLTKSDVWAELTTISSCIRLQRARYLRPLPDQKSSDGVLPQSCRGVFFSLVNIVSMQLHRESTTAQCVENYIKFKTASEKASYVEWVLGHGGEDLKDLVGNASAFVSHSWLQPYALLVEVLRRHQHCFWLDIFAINQHQPTKAGELDQLGATICSCRLLLLVAQPWSKPVPLSRVWCLYELHTAIASRTPIHMGLTPESEQDLLHIVSGNSSPVFDALDDVDVKNASATQPGDKIQIFSEISQGIGFDEFNARVAKEMRATFTRLILRLGSEGSPMNFPRESTD
eukprot:TRINITY_DN9767_c0_g4_i1.p1 TRINITY_DN9767_c0_g4~~TRINITY_DN9767_c0_g4_i1.p1  ORF type:complete len:609 (+),score=53.29 TRINITY_DN9767_c0_g4_i1:213-1829(+)